MNLTEQEKRKIEIQADIAQFCLKSIYDKFDIMSGHLNELVDMLDKDEYGWLHHFWNHLPTYNELDDLDKFLTKLKEEAKK
jgi:hypothetical protein